jgi:hypothetical protein
VRCFFLLTILAAIVHGPKKITYPTILDFEAPVVNAYSIVNRTSGNYSPSAFLIISSKFAFELVNNNFFSCLELRISMY